MISLRPSLITEHHSVSSLNDLAREASPCSTYLRPARDEHTTYTVGDNCSRVDGDRRIERVEPRSYSLDRRSDQTEARLATIPCRIWLTTTPRSPSAKGPRRSRPTRSRDRVNSSARAANGPLRLESISQAVGSVPHGARR